jgi:hypothetical protein
MNTHSHFRVRSLPTKSQNFFLTLLKRKKTKVIASIIGFYLVLSGGVGFMFFRPNTDFAQASNVPVAVAANFGINNIDAIVQSGLIDGKLTLTNQSLTEDLTNVSLDLYSTKESVKWNGLNYEGSQETITPNNETTFTLLPIKRNSTVDLNITGVLKNKSLPNVGLMAKIIFDSNQGQLETTSNRILIKLGEGPLIQGALPNLKTDKLEYLAKEKVFFNLEGFGSEQKNKIKLSISNKETGELIANTLECQSDIEGQCLISYDKLESGKYGAVFFDKDKNPASQIVNFEVKSQASETSITDFKANPNSSLELPFGSGSVGGQVAVLAQNVVGLNRTITNKDKCTFQISQNGSILQQFQTNVINKRCFSNLAISGEAGIYQLKLLGSPIEKSFSFLPKSKNVVNIQKISGGEKKQALKFKLSGIQFNSKKNISSNSSKSSESSINVVPTSKINAKISIHRIESGIVQEITTLNNNQIQIGGFEETLELPDTYFEQDGNYEIFVTLDNGQQSEFLNFEISDKSFGFATGGIAVKGGTELKLGQKNTFEINGLNYRNGKPVQSGTCENTVIEDDGTKTNANGEIQNGKCEFGIDSIKKSGGITIVNPKYNLASQFVLKSESATNFGDINIAFSPIFPNQTNKIIAGPFTDQFGNAVSQKNLYLIVENSSKNQVEIPIDITDGFGEVVIPSSLVNGEEISFKLLEGDKEIASKLYEISVEDVLQLPNIPNKIADDERVRGLFYTNIMNSDEKCKLKVVSIGQKNIEQDVNPVLENKSCSFDWGASDGKLSKKNLVNFKIGNSDYYYLINSSSSKPVQTFEVMTNITDNGNGTINVDLLTSNIKDSNGLSIQKGDLQWSFNGKNKNTQITNGAANLSIKLSDLDLSNTKKEGDSNFLNLEIDARASEISLSKTTRLNINLGKNTLSDKSNDFIPLYAQNIVDTNTYNIWRFQTPACDINQGEIIIRSYYEKGNCLIEFFSGEIGKNKMHFRNGNSIKDTFEFTTVESNKENTVCEKINEKCNIFITPEMDNLIISALSKEGELVIADADEDPSIFSLIKEGADTNVNHSIKISYNVITGENIVFYREISGKALSKE